MKDGLQIGGRFVKVTSLSNELVKAIRALHDKKHRDESGAFIAEGQKLIHDGLEKGWAIETLAYAAAQSAEGRIGALAARAKAAGATVMEVSGSVLEKITRRHNPQSVVGVFRQRFAPEAAIGGEGIWVALDRVRDAGNLGTIIRTADAAGIAGVALVGHCVDPFALETVRATMGSVFHVPVARTSEDGLIGQAERHRARLLGTHLSAATIDYKDAFYSAPLILLMGNEQQGLSERLAAACATLVRIPMREGADSLNLAVSAGLMIYETLRQDAS